MTASVNWLVKRVEGDIRSFFDTELALREEALRNQEGLRTEIRNLEDRCVRAEQALQGSNARIQEMDQEMQRKVRQFQDRMAQLEAAAVEDGKTIVDMRDMERTLRAELDQAVGKLRLADEQLNHTDRLMLDLTERARVAEERRSLDERALIEMREVVSRQQADIDHLLQQVAVSEDRMEQTGQKLRICEEQAAQDENTINELRDALNRAQSDMDMLAMQSSQLEERAVTSEAKLRALLDDVGEEVGRLRGEVEKHRHDLDVTTSYIPPSRMYSPRSALSPHTHTHHSMQHTMHSSSVMASPRPKGSSLTTPNREVNVAVRTNPGSNSQDISVRLDALQGMMARAAGGAR